MYTVTINIKNNALFDKIIWFLNLFKDDELEIISKEDIDDLKLLKATRNDISVSFEEYMKNEN